MSIRGVAINRNKLIQAIQDHRGCVRSICKDMEITTGTFYVYKKTDPEIDMVLKEAREVRAFEIETEEERILDKCYDAIVGMIEQCEPSAVIYTLSTLGRKRNPKWGKAPLVEEQQHKREVTVVYRTADDHRIELQSEVVPERLRDGDEDEEEGLPTLS